MNDTATQPGQAPQPESSPRGGLWVTLEGVDGTGKTTQLALLDDWLRGHGITPLITREPGGTDVGMLLRRILLDHPGELDPRAEALLFAADRGHHIATKVLPALRGGQLVLQDRYLDSSVAYQGAGRVLGHDEVRRLSLWATGGALPDVTILFDLDPALARHRAAAGRGGVDRFDRIEEAGLELQRRVREAYLDLARAEPERFVIVDSSPSPAQVHETVRTHLTPYLQKLSPQTVSPGN